jgi:hypothetical protein
MDSMSQSHAHQVVKNEDKGFMDVDNVKLEGEGNDDEMKRNRTEVRPPRESTNRTRPNFAALTSELGC